MGHTFLQPPICFIEMSQRGVFTVVGCEVAGGYKGILPDILLELKDVACE